LPEVQAATEPKALVALRVKDVTLARLVSALGLDDEE